MVQFQAALITSGTIWTCAFKADASSRRTGVGPRDVLVWASSAPQLSLCFGLLPHKVE